MRKYVYLGIFILVLLVSASIVTATDNDTLETNKNTVMSNTSKMDHFSESISDEKIIKKDIGKSNIKSDTAKHATEINLKTSNNSSHIIMNATLKSDIPVNTGYVIYKLNGVTLKNSTNETIKVQVVNSQATLTLPTQQYRRVYTSSEAVYSGNSLFEQSRSKQNNTINTRITPTIRVTQNQSSYFIGQTAKIDVYLSSNLTNAFNGIVIFKINGETIKNSNNEPLIVNMINNHISYNYTIPKGLNKGNFTFYVATEGSRYNKVSSELLLKIVHLDTNLSSSKISVDNNNYCTINATFKDKFNNPLVGKHYVDVYIDGKKLSLNNQATSFTLKDSNLNIYFPVDNYNVGIHTIQLSLKGNREYGAFQSQRYPLNITQKYPTRLILDTPLKARTASTLSLRGYVIYNDLNIHKTINKGTIIFKINNQNVSSNVHNGKAILSYRLPNTNGNYVITATYKGIDDLKDATTTKAIGLTSGSISASESAILGDKNPENERVALLNNAPNVIYMTNYVWADEDATYTLTADQLKEVIRKDSYCLYMNNHLSRYVAFKTQNESSIYHVLKREKWNVIEKELYKYLTSKNTDVYPNTLTVSLKGKSYTYCEVRDVQNTEYTCGPTSTSVCSQVLRNYVSEDTLAKAFGTYKTHGTNAYKILNVKQYNMTAEYFYKGTFTSTLNKLANGECALVFYTTNHYVSIIDINKDKTKVLISNSYGNYSLGGGKIPNGWLDVSFMRNKFVKNDNFGGLIIKLNYNLSAATQTRINNFYNNFVTGWERKNMNEELNN